MRKIKELFKSSLFAAVGVVLPLFLLVIVFEKIVVLLTAITNPFARVLFPVQFVSHVYAARLATVLVLLVASVGLGVFSQTSLGQRVGLWFEESFLLRVKLYRSFKNFSERLLPSQTKFLFQPALLVRADEMNTLIFVVEDYGADHVVIFTPSVPSAFSGSLAIVPRTDVQILNVPVMDVVRVYSSWGVGFSKLLEETHSAELLQRTGSRDVPTTPLV